MANCVSGRYYESRSLHWCEYIINHVLRHILLALGCPIMEARGTLHTAPPPLHVPRGSPSTKSLDALVGGLACR